MFSERDDTGILKLRTSYSRIDLSKRKFYVRRNLARPALTTRRVLLVVFAADVAAAAFTIDSSSSSLAYVAPPAFPVEAILAAAVPLADEVACIKSASGPGRCS